LPVLAFFCIVTAEELNVGEVSWLVCGSGDSKEGYKQDRDEDEAKFELVELSKDQYAELIKQLCKFKEAHNKIDDIIRV
jgi:hypothetical protein